MAPAPPVSLVTVVSRLTWMLLGPMALLLAVVGIVQLGNGWLTGPDIAFFVILGLMLVGRWVEFRTGAAQTADGQPATWRDVRSYLLWMPALALVAWIVANVIANYGQ